MTASPSIVEVEVDTVDVSWRTTWDVCVVTTSDASQGWGELSDAGPHEVARPLVRQAAALLTGLTVDAALDAVADEVERTVLALPPGAERRCRLTVLGGLDAALLDLAAQVAGVPLAEHLGGRGGATVELYANINRAIGPRHPDEFARVARAAVGAGFRTVKCAPFDFLVGARRLSRGLELVRAVRDAIGPDVALIVDAHHHLTRLDLRAVADDLRTLDLRWLEDAAPIGDVEWLAEVRRLVGAPVAGGEFASSVEELAPAVEAGVLDVVMPDVKHAGGPRRALELARFAAERGLEVSLHNPTGPVGTLVGAALMTALPTARILELAVGEADWRPTALEPPEAVSAGTLRLGDRPGLGATWGRARSTASRDPVAAGRAS